MCPQQLDQVGSGVKGIGDRTPNFMPAGASMPERPRGTFVRLSYSYLEPALLREGVRRFGGAIRTLRRAERPARQALPIA